MSTETKACNLTYSEIEEAIFEHGRNLSHDTEFRVERIYYLTRRLRAFKEEQPRTEAGTAPATTSVQPAPQGWGQ